MFFTTFFKKPLAVILIFCALQQLHAQQKVCKWDMYEITLKGPATGNPFISVKLSAEFKQGGQVLRPDGFYDGDGNYKIRFMPDNEGTWIYTTQSNSPGLDKKTGEFTCIAAAPNVHGPVKVRNQFHFGYADGMPFYPFGTTIYEWAFQKQNVKDSTISTLSKSPFNKARMLAVPPYNERYVNGPNRLTAFPFVGTKKEDFDFTHFNPEYFRSLEKDIKRLQDIGVEADLILFRPYDKGKWGFDMMADSTNIMFLKYMVARFAAFHNIWWSLSNENSYIKHIADYDWDRYFQVVQKADPYAHLRSIHNADRLYDYTKPWVTHVSLQYYNVVKAPWGTSLLRDVYKKPIVNDEINYEGKLNKRWGQLTGKEMTYRFWNAYIGGGYATHGETTPTSWIGPGGTLAGESPARIAFLRKIIEGGPAEGMTPIDQYFTPNLAGKPGEYYLFYLGENTPKKWDFLLPKAGLADGMKFKVDVIDTWNMTITPLERVFELKKKDEYKFGDKHGVAVNLPGNPFMALRIKLVGGDVPRDKKAKAPGDEL